MASGSGERAQLARFRLSGFAPWYKQLAAYGDATATEGTDPRLDAPG